MPEPLSRQPDEHSHAPQGQGLVAGFPHCYAPSRYITADLPGIGGRLKERPEDFLVDEVPLYPPSGSGEHIYLTVQKRLLSTYDMVSVIASHFGVRRRDVGYAGLKDKHAITRQTLSIYAPGRKLDEFRPLEHPSIIIQGATYHNNKLRPGHLRGNRFSIRIRGVDPTQVVNASKIITRLGVTGVPNRVGEQRFGMLENNHAIGAAILRADWQGVCDLLLGPCERFPEVNAESRAHYAAGRFHDALQAMPMRARVESIVLNALAKGYSAKGAVNLMDDTLMGFYLSAFQSAIFNAVLDQRVEEGTLGVLAAGDVAVKHDNLAAFSIDAQTAADPSTHDRLARFEISPSGPMWGGAMKRATDARDRIEREALERAGLTPDDMDSSRGRAQALIDGKRRLLRVPLIDPDVEGGMDELGPYVRLAFELPRGSFATVVAREVMKPANPKIAGPSDEPGET